MQEKDKIILNSVKDVAIEAAIDLVSKQFPAIEIAFRLATGYYGANIKLREKRALEFVELIKGSPDVFTQEILNSENFQDGFVFILEKYLSERNSEKRRIIGAIFLGFSVSQNMKSFELERLLITLQQVDIQSMELFKMFYDGSIKEWIITQSVFTEEDVKKQSELPINLIQIGKHIMSETKGQIEYESQDFLLEKIGSLVNLGLLLQAVDSLGVINSSYKASKFGSDFYNFISR